MIKLPNITLVCIDCINYDAAIKAIKHSVKEIKFGKVLFLTDRQFFGTKFQFIKIDKITSKEQYSEFVIKKLVNYINTRFCLIIQADGFVINPQLWDDNWLDYDYIGAPWWYDTNNVGNGGFSLRSTYLMKLVKQFVEDQNIQNVHPEDDFICRKIQLPGCTFAPDSVAEKFSFEPNKKHPKFLNNTFGFHGLVL
jgi:phage pi2 protein 07